MSPFSVISKARPSRLSIGAELRRVVTFATSIGQYITCPIFIARIWSRIETGFVNCGIVLPLLFIFILFICGVIAACELINSSIEATIDLITSEMHPLAKIAKDTASAASLVLCFVALIGGLIIFIPKFLGLF